jgi:hypothetical protein
MNTTSQVNTAQLLKILDCLIDTAEHTTDLNTVYNDRNGTSVEWSEIHAFRESLKISAPVMPAPMSKIELVKHVATEGGKLQRTIIDALSDDSAKTPTVVHIVKQKFASLNDLIQNAPMPVKNKPTLDVDTLISGCTLHSNKIIEWVIIYLLKNPKTDFECDIFNQAFNAAFPEEDADVLIDTLETLYRQGIANKHAIREYYIDDTAISIIDGRRKIIAFQKSENNTPIWDF